VIELRCHVVQRLRIRVVRVVRCVRADGEIDRKRSHHHRRERCGRRAPKHAIEAGFVGGRAACTADGDANLDRRERGRVDPCDRHDRRRGARRDRVARERRASVDFAPKKRRGARDRKRVEHLCSIVV